MHIAMWSGPRNLSTALMYSFSSRADCAVMDEPFYAAYLAATGADHPMAAEVIAAGETDPAEVVARCLAPPPEGKAHVYQKHMCHHMIATFDRSWMAQVTNVFLIRHPARVLASYAAKRENPTLEDIGFAAQAEMVAAVRAAGETPIVIDSADLRAAPEPMLRALCEAIGIGFDPAMLRWPAGPNPADGIWARHWYGAVHRSTGFAGPEGPLPEVDAAHRAIHDRALEIYTELAALALRP